MGSFWSKLGEYIGEAINEAGNSVINDLKKQRQKEDEEFIESIQSMREDIKTFRDSLCDFLLDYDEIDTYDEVGEKIMSILIMSCLCARKKDIYDELVKDDACNYSEFEKVIQQFELFGEAIEDTDDIEAEPLKRTFGHFFATMNAVYEVLTESDDAIDIEMLYQRSQKAVTRVINKLGTIIRLLDEAIEEAYEIF